MFDVEAHLRRIEADGFTVIPDFLDPATLTEARRVLAFYLGSHLGRNDFEGTRTERVYTLVARGRVFWPIVLDPRVLALCERLLQPGFLLTASQAIAIQPGETPQPFHYDDTFYRLPRPRPMVSLSTIVAVDAFTDDNGGTEVVPGSHRWSDAELGRPFDVLAAPTPELARAEASLAERARTVTMPAGACLVFAGTLLHRGGRNRSPHPRCAVSNQYCEPWARQQENFVLAVPPEVARQMPERLREMLGYSIHPPFMGQLSASHPRKALDPDYRNPLVAQARAAGARLPE
ncbi:phytanoyl-CoA dioxygenase family protein [bacterium]|nr:phytanoyl-CoA dioxygenase family protein [bacterium]